MKNTSFSLSSFLKIKYCKNSLIIEFKNIKYNIIYITNIINIFVYIFNINGHYLNKLRLIRIQIKPIITK